MVFYNYLLNNGHKVGVIHGDLDNKVRRQMMRRIKDNEFVYIVCSDIAARGIDIEGVSHVINYDLPKELEFFYHRAGRTGRAGNTGINIVIGDGYEMKKYSNLEKKLKLVVYPKVLHSGKVVNPMDFDAE